MVDITLTNGKFSASHISGAYAQSFTITNTISKDKMIVVSICDAQDAAGNKVDEYNKGFTINLNSSSIKKHQSGLLNSITYFMTTANVSKIPLTISKPANNNVTLYSFNIVVVDAINKFTPCDCDKSSGNLAKSSYVISNEPEYLRTSTCRGDTSKKYLCRGRLNANAQVRVYYEHYSQYTGDMRFGVLLWNLDSKKVKVKVLGRNIWCGFSQASIHSAWTDTIYGIVNEDKSDLPNGGEIEIPAYSAANPSASAVWVALSNVVNGSGDFGGYFNGVVTLQLSSSGAADSGMGRLVCDTYIMAAANTNYIKTNIKDMTLSPSGGGQNIRGSADGALLTTTLSTTPKTSDDESLSYLITGHDVPWLQSGALLPLYNYTVTNLTTTPQLSASLATQNGYNYGIMYRFVFPNGINSGGETIKVRVRIRPETNASAVEKENWPGIHVVGIIDGTGLPFYGTAFVDSDFQLPTTLSSGKSFTLNIVVCAMSSMPAEITFATK